MNLIHTLFKRTGIFAGFSFLVVSCLMLVSCSSSTSPSIPSGPSGSYNITLYTPEILAAIAKQGGIVNAASVMLETDTQPVTNASVTLTGPSLSLPLTFSSSVTLGSNYATYYWSVNSWAYTGNQNYTMTVSYGGHTYQSTITSVGNVSFATGSSGVTISWAGGGNENTASALCISPAYHSYTYGPNITSSYAIAQSSLAGYSGGNYTIQLNADETLTSAFSGGAYLGCSFTASDQESTTY